MKTKIILIVSLLVVFSVIAFFVISKGTDKPTDVTNPAVTNPAVTNPDGVVSAVVVADTLPITDPIEQAPLYTSAFNDITISDAEVARLAEVARVAEAARVVEAARLANLAEAARIEEQEAARIASENARAAVAVASGDSNQAAAITAGIRDRARRRAADAAARQAEADRLAALTQAQKDAEAREANRLMSLTIQEWAAEAAENRAEAARQAETACVSAACDAERVRVAEATRLHQEGLARKSNPVTKTYTFSTPIQVIPPIPDEVTIKVNKDAAGNLTFNPDITQIGMTVGVPYKFKSPGSWGGLAGIHVYLRTANKEHVYWNAPFPGNATRRGTFVTLSDDDLENGVLAYTGIGPSVTPGQNIDRKWTLLTANPAPGIRTEMIPTDVNVDYTYGKACSGQAVLKIYNRKDTDTQSRSDLPREMINYCTSSPDCGFIWAESDRSKYYACRMSSADNYDRDYWRFNKN